MNQSKTGASRSCAALRLPFSPQSRARLVAARSSSDLASWSLATLTACLKASSASSLFRAERASIHVHAESSKISLNLESVRIPAADTYKGNIQIAIDVRAIAEQSRRSERDKDLQSDMLLAEVKRGVRSKKGSEVARYTVHRRACFALISFLLAPIGFCIGVLARERGRMLALVLAMAPVFVFYLADFLGAKLVRMWDFPLLGWLPAAVLIVIGGPFCWRLLRY